MSDEELDAAIAERFRAYEAGIHLPDEFKGRLIGSVRRKRTLRHIWMLGLAGIAAIACVTVVNFVRPHAARGDMEPMLMARTAPTNDVPAVSYWLLFGYLRECLSRSRSVRRKEEE